MKKSFLALIATIGFLASCGQNNSSDQKDTGQVGTNLQDTTVKECYSYINNRDTITLTLTKTGDSISGNLNYNLFEKDRNTGSIVGKMHSDTLLADYTFLSEGINSTRQVAFLKKDNQLIEGFGDVEEKEGKMIFKNPAALTFSNSVIKLTKIDCN